MTFNAFHFCFEQSRMKSNVDIYAGFVTLLSFYISKKYVMYDMYHQR